MFATCGPNFGEVINIQAISWEKSSSVFVLVFFFYDYYNLSEIEFNKVQSKFAYPTINKFAYGIV